MEIFDYLPESYKTLYDKWEPTLNGQLHISGYWIFLVLILMTVLIYEVIYYDNPTIKDLKHIKEKKLVDYILEQVRNNHAVNINWKASLLTALIISFILSYLLFFPFRIPPGFVYFFLVLIIWGITYFSMNWVTSHWWKMNDYKIESALLKYRHNT